MKALYKIPFDQKIVNTFLEEEKDFLIGLLRLIEGIDETSVNKKATDVITTLKGTLPEYVEQIFPSKKPSSQIKSLQEIANIFASTFGKTKFETLGIKTRWIPLDNGYLGRVVEENYEIAILLYLVSAVYQSKAIENVQTSLQYRYYHISSLAALLGAIAFIEKITPDQEGHYAKPFYKMLLLRKLEIEAEITKSEAFLARKQGDFDKASKLFAGAASYRFSMMNFDLTEDSDTRVKILASTELGMSCFYIAVGFSNTGESEKAYKYLLKARSYFENAAKLSEINTELLDAANKRLDLVSPYIDRIKDTIEENDFEIEKIPDPQPLMVYPVPEPLLTPTSKVMELSRICSQCNAKIPWSDKCSKCGEVILPFE